MSFFLHSAGAWLPILLFAYLMVIVLVLMGQIKLKKRTIAVISGAMTIVFLGTLYFLQFSTFDREFAGRLDSESKINEISIYELDLTNGWPKRIAKVTIDEEQTLENIIADFSGIRLLRDRNHREYPRYELAVVVTNQKTMESGTTYFQTTTERIGLSKERLNEFQIIGQSDHLQTVSDIIENKETEWEIIDRRNELE